MADKPQEAHKPQPKRSVFLAEERTGLALKRTVLAADRTLLAWARTSLSLMTFGFSIYKFFQYLQESGAAGAGWQPTGPRRFGIVLVTLATVLLLWQTWDYYRLIKRFGAAQGRKSRVTPTLVAGVAVSALGLVVLGSIIFRVRLF